MGRVYKHSVGYRGNSTTSGTLRVQGALGRVMQSRERRRGKKKEEEEL